MNNYYILDTNICIYIMNNSPAKVLTKFTNFKSPSIGISVITYGELLYGFYKSKKQYKSKFTLNNFINNIDVVPLDENVANYYGTIYADLSKKGQIIGNNDLWIAAHTLSLKAILVSNNLKEFSRVSELKVENWI